MMQPTITTNAYTAAASWQPSASPAASSSESGLLTQQSPVNRLGEDGASKSETFLERAERYLLLARMGVDMESLERVEQQIEQLEGKGNLSKQESLELESLQEQRAELFRQANERRHGETLPPGSVFSLTA